MEPLLIPIPAGSKAGTCRGQRCGLVTYWADHPKTGKRHLVSLDDPRAKAPTATEDGVGISHWTNCVDRDAFKTPRTTTERR